MFDVEHGDHAVVVVDHVAHAVLATARAALEGLAQRCTYPSRLGGKRSDRLEVIDRHEHDVFAARSW